MENNVKNSKIWKGLSVPTPFSMDYMFSDFIWEKFNKIDPQKVLQICTDDDTELTCGELKLSAIRVAKNLIKIGIKSDDVIGVITHQSHMATILINGVILVGALINPVDATLDEKDIRSVYLNTKPKMIICDEEAIPKLKSALSDVDFSYEIFSTSSDSSDYLKASDLLKLTNEEEEFVPPKFEVPSDEKVLAILCTSGTTGSPKGFKLSNAYVIGICTVISFMEKHGGNTVDRTLCMSSLFWSTGFYQNITLMATKSQRIFTRNTFSVDEVIKIVEKYEVNSFTSVVSAIATLLNSDDFLASKNQSLKTFMAAGSIVTKTLRNKFESTFPDRNFLTPYGMTEIGITLSKPEEYKIEASVGSIIFPNTIVKIVDDNEKALDVGEVGEICAKANLKFLGYYNNPEATKEALDSEGFVKTGDLGYFNKDGILCVIDRKKNILKYKGYSLNPSEIEDVIQSLKGVEAVSVVGIPDSHDSSLTAAAIVKTKSSNLTEEEVLKFIESKFPFYK